MNFIKKILLESLNNDTLFYHGSNEKFLNFDIINNKTYKEFDIPVWFFTEDKEYAKSYGKFLYVVKLHNKKLFDTSNSKDFALFKNQVEEFEHDLDEILDEQFFNGLPYWTCEDAYYAAISNGYDSILLQEELEKEILSIGIFNKEDIEILKVI